MYENFKINFPCDGNIHPVEAASLFAKSGDHSLDDLLSLFGGCSFRNGLYRIISPQRIGEWNNIIIDAFPEFSGRIICFAYDWLGRVFALDSGRLEDKRFGVIMFEPGTGEALEIPCNIETFHENELIEYTEEALAESFNNEWQRNGGASPAYEECIGYKVPLFIGGKDTVENLELSSLEVYWGLAVQLIKKTKGLPPGTPIGSITIN